MTKSNTLKAKRLEAGYTQNQLAELAGVSPRTVIRAELGYALPRRSTVTVLAQALNIAPAALTD